MAKLKYKGDWEDVKERLMAEYPSLTERDFQEEDHPQKLLNYLGQKLGEEPDDMRRIIRDI